MLYKDNNDTLPLDSLPLAVKPFYLSKTDVNGDFQLNGLANETFLMFAIIDMNGNYFYDQPGEEIAFLDSIIQPQFIDIPVIDTSILDSLITDFDQLSPDSIEALIDSIYHDSLHASLDKLTKYTLNFFAEDDTTQRLEKAELMQKNILRFSFSRPADEITMESINFNPDTVWYKEEFTPNKDTIFWYLKELPFDTLEIVFKHRGDTLEHEYIRVNPRKAFPAGETRKQKKEDEKKKEYFGYSFNLQSGILRLNAQPMVTFVSPVADFYTDSVLLVKGDDSLYNPEFIFIDSMHRKILFPIELEESMRYSIILPDDIHPDAASGLVKLKFFLHDSGGGSIPSWLRSLHEDNVDVLCRNTQHLAQGVYFLPTSPHHISTLHGKARLLLGLFPDKRFIPLPLVY